nr:RNA-directed DNA polymerase, eukaryota, reverse transcriptase zinc-binding domain protein [Tanacetum cinerariifolium]
MVRDGRGCFATTTTRSIWKSALIILFLKVMKTEHHPSISLTFQIILMPARCGRSVNHMGGLLTLLLQGKHLKLGKRFGFVKFTGIANDDMFVRSLSNIWIGNFHVFVAVAKFQRSMGSNEGVKIPTRKGEPNQGPHISNVRKSNDANMHQSYVSIVNGGVPSKNSGTSSGVKKMVTLCEGELTSIDNSMDSVLVKVKDVGTMINMYRLCRTCKRVATMFGKFMFFQINNAENFSTCRSCIATKQKKFINEEVSVMINGETFEVHVRELSNWSVKIVDDIESEDERSEDENFDTQA